MVNGEKILKWKRVPAAQVVNNKRAIVRCVECWGAVRKHRQLIPTGPAPHVEHKHHEDSENCS